MRPRSARLQLGYPTLTLGEPHSAFDDEAHVRQDMTCIERGDVDVLDHRYADHVEFAYIDNAAHYITDDAPAAVADLAIDWFERAA